MYLNPLKLDYPPQITSVWGKIAYHYQYRMNEIDTSRGQIFGKITQPIVDIGIILGFLAYFNEKGYISLEVTPKFLVVSVISFTFIVWLGGFLYLKINMDKVRNIVTRQRDPVFLEIHSAVNNEIKRKEKI